MLQNNDLDKRQPTQTQAADTATYKDGLTETRPAAHKPSAITGAATVKDIAFPIIAPIWGFETPAAFQRKSEGL